MKKFMALILLFCVINATELKTESKIDSKDDNFFRDMITIMSHKENYMIFYYSMPPYGTYAYNMPQEIKSQLSIKAPLWRNAIFKNAALYVGYTQTLWFQFLNFSYSSPVRNNNYEVEFFYNYPIDVNFLHGKLKYLQIGYLHLSNGVGGYDCYRSKDVPRSASCQSRSAGNRIIFSANQEWSINGKILGVTINAWPYVPTRQDNADLKDYIGYGDMRLYFQGKRNMFEIFIGSIFTNYFNYKGNIRAGYTFKVNKYYGIYAQYFFGYGDSLYEYNIKSHRIGIGLRFAMF